MAKTKRSGMKHIRDNLYEYRGKRYWKIGIYFFTTKELQKASKRG